MQFDFKVTKSLIFDGFYEYLSNSYKRKRTFTVVKNFKICKTRFEILMFCISNRISSREKKENIQNVSL